MPPWHNRFAGRTSQPAHRVGAPGPETKPTVGNQGKGGAAPEATAEVAQAPRTYPDGPGGIPGYADAPWMDPAKLVHAGGEGKAELVDNRYCDLCGGIGTVAAFESPAAGSDEYGPVGVCSFCLERLLRMFYARFGRPRTDRLAP